MSNLQKIIDLYGNTPNQLIGITPLAPESITTYERYCNIYKVRHDLVHSLVCDKFEVEFGEKTVALKLSEAKIEAKLLKYYHDISDQTPDYINFNKIEKTCTMFEISVSRSQDAKRHKTSKYALLAHFITKELKYSLDYKVMIFFPLDVYRDRQSLLLQGLDDHVLGVIDKICKNAEILLAKVHETSEGQMYFSTFNDIIEEKISLDFTKLDCLRTNKEFPGVFIDNAQFDKVLNGSKTTDHDTNQMMEEMVKLVDNFEPELLIQPKKFNEQEFMKEMKSRSTSTMLRSVFPLPYIRMNIIDSSIRSTTDDLEVIRRIGAKMISSEDPVLSTIGDAISSYFNKVDVKTNEDLMFDCRLDESVKNSIALDGPGRKAYIKKGSKKHIREQIKYNGYALDPTIDVSDLERIIFLLSSRSQLMETGDVLSNIDSILNLRGLGLDYVRICQSIYRELNINAMRGNRRRKFILKPTGVRGVNILIFPGAKLRSGEMPNLIWFKVIIERELHLDDDLSNHWCFKKLHRSGQILHSDWLSSDVHRLDHYIRAFDKIIMVYFSFLSLKTREYTIMEYMESKKLDQDDYVSMATDRDDLFDMMRNQSLVGLFNMDKTDALGLIIVIYLEDRRSTSKMLQQVRYLFMTSISMTPQYKSVFDKMGSAIRSPLQSYLLNNCIQFHKKMKSWRPSGHCVFGRISYDQKTQVINDTHGGSILLFPRILIKPESFSSFHEVLCEMYFTMLFNKNQDDPTHASFQVLDKIIEGEESFKESKEVKMIYGEDGKDPIQYARKLIENPHLHQFSKLAIEIGTRLLRKSHMDPLNDEIKRSCLKKSVNKTLDQFATYKSSSTMTYAHYDPKILRQNKRTKCINAIMPLLKDGLMTSFDVAEKYKDELTYYQVFKKNQIGGVREILILPITNRIRINILETISRNICEFDNREILTHGNTKNESIKSLLYRSKRHSDRRSQIHLTFDKSKWGPSFIPIQFMYLFTNYKDQMGPLYYFILDILIRHQHKTCLMPDRLVKAWYLDQDNLHKHKYDSLQLVKNKFLMDKDLRYKNESNMGQGILHFTSSYLHLCLISFRDELYKRACKKRGWSHDDHEDLLSSDDSYTLFLPELLKEKTNSFIREKLRVFLSCQEISERLFNCRTSLNKSSLNPLVGEFNSLFISNMTFIPTLIKFALSSVHPVNTDSFYRMVKESYSSSRQIIENGGTMDLYLLSHRLNKLYCESIYHTSEGGFNDRHHLNLNIIPYQMGVYPVFNPALMLIFGPEYYNYKLYKRNWNNMTPLEKKFFKNCHKVIRGSMMETMGEFEENDTLLGGLLRIEASIGPVKQLENFKRSAIMTQEEMRAMITEDPLLILRNPKTLKEVIFKTCQKLYTNGAKEAVKTLAASIFYGRVSATVSAEAFYIPGHNEKMTYRSCLEKILSEVEIDNFDEHFKFLYPTYNEYDIFLDKEEFVFDYKRRHPLEVQTVQKLSTHKIKTRLVNSVPDLLEYHWGLKPIPIGLENQVGRDIEIINLHYGIIKKSIELTYEQFSGDLEEKTKKLLMLILKLYRLRDRSFKGIIYGISSDDLVRTYMNLLEKNVTQGFSTRIHRDVYPFKYTAQSYEEMFCAHNYDILRILHGLKPKYFKKIDHVVINNFLSDSTVSRNQKKRIFMLAVCTEEHINDIETWSEKTSIIVHFWRQKQIYYEGKYQGDFELCLFSGRRRFVMRYHSYNDHYSLYYQMEEDPQLLYRYLLECADILQINIESILTKVSSGNFICMDKKIIKTESIGFNMMELKIGFNIPYRTCNLSITEEKMSLVNWDSHKQSNIINVELGLLPTHFIPDIEDFPCYGLSFLKLCEIGAFSHTFNVVNIPKETALHCLEDLKIVEPLISENTKKKFPNIDLSVSMENKNTDSSIEILDKDTIILGFADVDLSDFKIEEIFDDKARFDDILDYVNSSDLINTLSVSTKTVHTKKILQIIKTLKYELISYMFSTQVRLSSRIIKGISKMLIGFRKEDYDSIIKSLIATYDRQENTPGTITPDNIDFSIYKKFHEKFNLEFD